MDKRVYLRCVYVKIVNIVKILWENNVDIVAGTDLPNLALTSGLSLWEELDILLEADLNIWDALKTATGIASEIIGSKNGVIIDGGRANILILSKTPKTLTDLMSIDKLVLGEKVLDIEELKSQMKKLPFFGM